LSTPDTTDGQKAVKQQEERSASYYFFIGEYEKARTSFTKFTAEESDSARISNKAPPSRTLNIQD